MSIYQNIRTQAAAAFNGTGNPHYTTGAVGFSPRVMSAPPTITQGTTNALATGRQYQPTLAGAARTSFNIQCGVEQLSGPYLGWYEVTDYYTGSGNLTNGPPPRSSNCSRLRFCTTAAQISIGVTGGNFLRFIVDGVFVSLAPTSISALGYLLLDFSAVGGAAPRTIEIETVAGARLYAAAAYGIWVPATASVYAPRYVDPLKWIQMGDSITAGTGATFQADAYPNVLGDFLGVSNMWPSGSGGTGYVLGPALGTPKFNGLQRLAYDALPYSPDVYGLAYGVNDLSLPVAAVTDNVRRCIGWIRQYAPVAPIFVWGVFFSQNQEAAVLAMETAILSAVKKLIGAGDENLFCVPVATAPGGAWLVESQRTTYLSDGVHPNTIGHWYYGRRSAQAVLEAIKDKE